MSRDFWIFLALAAALNTWIEWHCNRVCRRRAPATPSNEETKR